MNALIRSKRKWLRQSIKTFLAFLIVALTPPTIWSEDAEAPTGKFESLAKPVRIGRLHKTFVGPDEKGRMNWVYQAFGQAGRNGAFLLVTDPAEGTSRQFFLPESLSPQGARGVKTIYAHEGTVYVGTYQYTYLLRFDPRHPEKGLQLCGDGPLEAASMVWEIRAAADGRLYLTTSGRDCKLFSYDIAANEIKDHGVLSPGNKYAQEVVISHDRKTLYIAVGTRKHDVLAYSVETGQTRSLLDEAHRKKGFLSLRTSDFVLRPGVVETVIGKEEEGALYAVPHSNEYAIHLGQKGAILPKSRANQLFADGGSIVSDTPTKLHIERADGTQKTIELSYTAGTRLITLWPWADRLYFSSTAPLKIGYYDTETGQTTVLGNPMRYAGGNVRSASEWKGKMVLVAYSGSDMALYDPGQPWRPGPAPENNPWTWGFADGTKKGHYARHTHPAEVVTGKDGYVYIATEPDRGREGGFVCVDPNTGKNIYEVLLASDKKAHTPVNLAPDPDRAVIYRGHRDGRVTAWDCTTREILWEAVPAPKEGGRHPGVPIAALHTLNGEVVGTTYNGDDLNRSTYFRIAPGNGQILDQRKIDFGGVIRTNLRLGPDGWLYGISRSEKRLFRIQPKTGNAQLIAQTPPDSQAYGLAVTNDGLYFARGGELMRFRFDKPLPQKLERN